MTEIPAQIPPHLYPSEHSEMRGHTPWGFEWLMLRAQNNAWGPHAIPYKKRMEYRRGVVGCDITFHLPDERWDEDEAWEAEANQQLIMCAPLLYAEVKQLREWKAEVERICRTMNGPNRDTALFIMTNEVEEE